MQARSIKATSATGINTALQQSMADGYHPTLAFVFISVQEDIDAVTAILNAAGITIFGASTSRKFNEEGIQEDGIVILLMDMRSANFKLIPQDFRGASVYGSACIVGEAGKESFEHPAFIISTADIRTPADDVINGLLNKAGQDVAIIGGVAGDHTNFTGTIFTNQSKTNSGLMALIPDQDNIDVKGVAVSGWKPVGTEKKITKSEGNRVYTINDEPAMEVVKKFLGTELVINGESIRVDIFPLQVQRPAGKPVMYPILSWNNDDQSIMLGAPGQEGSMFRFSLPPNLEVIDTVIESTKIIKKNELPDADAMLVFPVQAGLHNWGLCCQPK